MAGYERQSFMARGRYSKWRAGVKGKPIARQTLEGGPAGPYTQKPGKTPPKWRGHSSWVGVRRVGWSESTSITRAGSKASDFGSPFARFRDAIRSAGTCSNLADGRVQLVAEGDAAELRDFLADVATAMHGKIQQCQVSRSAAHEGFREFEVRY